MKTLTTIKFILFILFQLYTVAYYGQQKRSAFEETLNLINENSITKAIVMKEQNDKQLAKDQKLFLEVILLNTLNKNQASEEKFNAFLKMKSKMHDSLVYNLYDVQKDNALKLFNYKEALEVTKQILVKFSKYISDKEKENLANDTSIYTLLKNTGAQKITLKQNTVIPIKTDRVGLRNLSVSSDKDTLDFIFDTGANLSVVSESVAAKFKMNVLGGSIKVSAITGKQVEAQIAVCKKLKVGDVEFENVVFLVFRDADLNIKQIAYQINGILGYPVISAMNKIRISQKGTFEVIRDQYEVKEGNPIAMNGLTPIMFINDQPYKFDTGASHTMLYQPYYKSQDSSAFSKYPLTMEKIGGVGGSKSYKAYRINVPFKVSGRLINLENVSLYIEEVSGRKNYFGTIGQDVINQFESMVIDFDTMKIQFE